MPAKPPTDAPKEADNPIEDDKMKKPTRFIPLLAFAELCEAAIAKNHARVDTPPVAHLSLH